MGRRAPFDLQAQRVHDHGLVESRQHRRDVSIFFGIYFCLTGLHGIHVLVGIVVLSWVLFKVIRRKITPEYYTPVDLGALYWHLVDLVWIFLFPLLYLIR